MIVQRRRVIDYMINGDTVTITLNKSSTRNNSLITATNRSITPTGPDTGKVFTYTVDPPATPNEVIDVSFDASHLGVGKKSARILRNITVPTYPASISGFRYIVEDYALITVGWDGIRPVTLDATLNGETTRVYAGRGNLYVANETYPGDTPITFTLTPTDVASPVESVVTAFMPPINLDYNAVKGDDDLYTVTLTFDNANSNAINVYRVISEVQDTTDAELIGQTNDGTLIITGVTAGTYFYGVGYISGADRVSPLAFITVSME